jgi:hypothetical protein
MLRRRLSTCHKMAKISAPVKGKGKDIPLQAWEDSWGSRRLRLLDLLDTRQYEGGKGITLTHRPSLPTGSSWYSFLEAELTPGHIIPSERRKKSPVKPLGIDPETLRLVAQCLNQLRHQLPQYLYKTHNSSYKQSMCTEHTLCYIFPPSWSALHV